MCISHTLIFLHSIFADCLGVYGEKYLGYFSFAREWGNAICLQLDFHPKTINSQLINPPHITFLV